MKVKKLVATIQCTDYDTVNILLQGFKNEHYDIISEELKDSNNFTIGEKLTIYRYMER